MIPITSDTENYFQQSEVMLNAPVPFAGLRKTRQVAASAAECLRHLGISSDIRGNLARKSPLAQL